MNQVTKSNRLLFIVLVFAVLGASVLLYCESSSKEIEHQEKTRSPQPSQTIKATKSPTPAPVYISTDSEVFPDDNVERAIRKAIGKPTGTLKQSDIENVTELVLRNVSDLAGLEKCTELTYLDLNQYSRPKFEYYDDGRPPAPLGLPYPINTVSNILPLVENPGLGEGDAVDLRTLPLDEESIQVYVPELEARGVLVYTDPEDDPQYIYNPKLNFSGQ